jgi:hypothetical protein
MAARITYCVRLGSRSTRYAHLVFLLGNAFGEPRDVKIYVWLARRRAHGAFQLPG